jgi:predicted NUDIX family NTP pyrophosphohydrolase
MKRNSGIFLFNRGKFLLVHSTNKNSLAWSIPKGSVKGSLTAEQVVVKKLEQVANIDRKMYGPITLLGEERNPIGNTSFLGHVATIRDPLMKLDLSCNYIVDDSASKKSFPAIDEYMWVTKEEGARFLPPYFSKLIEKL